MTATAAIDVQDVINRHPLSGFQKRIIGLCFLVVMIDGFDTAAVGFIAPALRADWQLTPAQLAPMFGAGLFGLMIGAFVFGPLADKVGRKSVLIITTLFFGAATLASAAATSIEMLTLLRFITGLGLGGAMPAAITLTSEFCTDHKRSSLVTLMFCGFTIGSGAAGLAASPLVASFGWQDLLILGGVLPIALVPVLWLTLPESARYLTLKDGAPERIAATLRRVAPDVDFANAAFTGVRKRHCSLVIHLFRGGLAAMLASSGTFGAILIGRLMDRFDPPRVLAAAYALAGTFVVLLGSATASPALLVFAIFGAGFGVAGAQMGANALAAASYPTANRATGVS